MLSYWEKTEMLEVDLLVLGGGITGMFCALTYRKQYPNARIAILERGLFPSGASTKNAGFACFGSLTELIEDSETMGMEPMMDLVKLRIEGLALLRETLSDDAMEYQKYGGYELFFESHPKVFEKIDEVNTRLYNIFNQLIYSKKNNKIKSFGLDTKKVHHLIENPFEGQIHTAKMMAALKSLVVQNHISFYTQTEVKGYDFNPSINLLEVEIKEQRFKFQTRKLALCTNAFTKHFYEETDLQPGRGMILVTKPIKNLQIKGAFHYNSGYYYFRNIEDRVLLGGGRELDFDSETTTAFGINPIIKEKLNSDLRSFILPEQDFEIEMEWSGIMAFGTNKVPLIRKLDHHVAMGVRLGGMGIAIGSKVGQATAKLLFD